MKNEIYKYTFLISVFLLSCKYDTKNTAQRNAENYRMCKNPEQCFMAIYQKDSATLKYKMMPNGKIQGHLVINYGEPEPDALKKEFYNGEIEGKFAKDTLFADYIFTDGAVKTVYRNPIAMLKKGNKLVLGFGVTITYLGRSWLRNHQAINFNWSRFQFVPAECNN